MTPVVWERMVTSIDPRSGLRLLRLPGRDHDPNDVIARSA